MARLDGPVVRRRARSFDYNRPVDRRELAANLALLAGSVTLTALLLEGGLRLWNARAPEAARPDHSDCTLEAVNPAPRDPSMGFQLRDYDYPFEKGDVYRIVATGDSFTHGGRHVSLCDSWPKQLEARLARALDRPVEVVNGGLPGWNTTHELAYLRERGLRFEPDLVIVGYFLNDATRMGTNPLLTWRQGREESEPVSHLVAAIRRAIVREQVSAETIQAYKDAFFVKKRLWERNQKALLAMRDLAASEGFELLVVLYPILFQLDDDYPFADIIATVEGFLKANDIPSVNLLPPFVGQRDRELWVTATNAHPNRVANEIASSAIARAVVERFPQTRGAP